jgi:hypothetical protein
VSIGVTYVMEKWTAGTVRTKLNVGSWNKMYVTLENIDVSMVNVSQ